MAEVTGRHLAVEPRPDTNQERKYEVLFRQGYVQYHPWGWGDIPCTFPVQMLCHATHNAEAAQICANAPLFQFQVHPKFGKTYDNHTNFGESYYSIPEEYDLQHENPPTEDSRYGPLPSNCPLFPGYYSWWGLAVDTMLSPEWIDSKYLPPYLKRPPESVYGGNLFKSSFHKLLELYAASRCCLIQEICLKMGGTLRYKREIAYVVIVCTVRDLGALHNYKAITHAPHDVFDPKGLVDCNGSVINAACVPSFTTHYTNPFVSYETLNFAFYFSEQTPFVCSEGITCERIVHESFCIRPTRPIAVFFYINTRQFTTKRVCADYTSAKDQQQHDKVILFARKCYGVEWDERNYY